MGLFDKTRKKISDAIAPQEHAKNTVHTYGNMQLIGHELRIKLTRDAVCKSNIKAFLDAGIDGGQATLVDEGDRYACIMNGLAIGRCRREDYEDIKAFSPIYCTAVMRDYDGNLWSACSAYDK